MQIYVSDDLRDLLRAEFGEGRVSANIERILRLHLENPNREKQEKLKAIQVLVRGFNASFPDLHAELVIDEKKGGEHEPGK